MTGPRPTNIPGSTTGVDPFGIDVSNPQSMPQSINTDPFGIDIEAPETEPVLPTTAMGIQAAESQNRAENVARLEALLQRSDIGPEQRTRLQSMIERTRDPFAYNQVEQDRTPGSDLLRGIGRSAVDAPIGVVDMALRLADIVLPGDPRLRDFTAEGLAASKQLFDPEGVEGTLGYVAGFLLTPIASGAAIGTAAKTSRMAAYGAAVLNPYGRAVGVSAAMARRLPFIGTQVQAVFEAASKPGAALSTRIAAQAIGSMGMDGVDLLNIALDPELSPEERNQRMALTIMGSLGGNIIPDVGSNLWGKVTRKPFDGLGEADNPFGLPNRNRESSVSKPEEMLTREELDRQTREGNEMLKRAREAEKRNKFRNRMARNAKRIWESANLDKNWKRLSASDRDKIVNDYINGLPDSVRKEYGDPAFAEHAPSAGPTAEPPRASGEPPRTSTEPPKAKKPHSQTRPADSSTYHQQFDQRVVRFVELLGNMTLPDENGEPRFVDHKELDRLFNEIRDTSLGSQVNDAYNHADQPWASRPKGFNFNSAWADGTARAKLAELAKKYNIDLNASQAPTPEPWPQGQLGSGQKLIGAGQRSESQTGNNPIPTGKVPASRIMSVDENAQRGAYAIWRVYPAEKRALVFTDISQDILNKDWKDLSEGEMEVITNFMKQAIGLEGEALAQEGRVVGSIGPSEEPSTLAPDATADPSRETPEELSPTPSPTSPPPTGVEGQLRTQLEAETERRKSAERDAYQDVKTGTGNTNLFARRLGLESADDINSAIAAPGKTILAWDAKNLGPANDVATTTAGGDSSRGQIEGDKYLMVHANAGKQALHELVPELVTSGQAQVFRIGGDEFAILGLTPLQAMQVAKRIKQIVGEPEFGKLGNTVVRGGVYIGHSPKYASVSERIADLKAKDSTRVKNIVKAVLEGKTPKQPKIDPIKRTENDIAVDLEDVKTEKGLDKIEGRLDKMHENGEITEFQWAREVNKIMEARGKLNAGKPKDTGFDRSVVRTVNTTKSTDAQNRAGPETRRRDNNSFIENPGPEVTAGKHQAQEEIKKAKADFARRYRSPIKGMTDADLQAHISELDAILLGKPKPRGTDPFTAERSRLSDVMEEQTRRKEPPADPTNNAPGVLLQTPPEVVGASAGAAWGWITTPEDEEQSRLENALHWAVIGAGAGYATRRYINRARNSVKMLPGQEAVRKAVITASDTDHVERTVGVDTWWSRQYAAYVRRSQPIETAYNSVANVRTPMERNAAKQAELFGLSQSQADQAILGDGVYAIGEDGRLIQFYDKSMRNIAEVVRGDMRTLGEIAAAGRTLELAQQAKPRKTPIDLTSAAQLWMSRPAKFEEARKMLREFNLAVAKMGEWSGLLRSGTADMWASEQLYAPMMKALDYVGEMIDTKKRRSGGTGTGQPFQRLKGGTLPIKNPVDASIEFTHVVYRRSEFNRVAKTFFEQMANASPRDREILGLREINFTRPEDGDLDSLILEGADDVAKILQKEMIEQGQNISEERAKQLIEMFSSDLLNYKGDVVVYYDKGVKRAWRVNPAIAKAFKVLRPAELEAMLHSTGGIRGIAEGITNVARIGITANPVFIAFQAFRDIFQFFMNGAHSNPEIAGMTGLSGLVAKTIDAPIALGSSAIYSMLGLGHQLLSTKAYREFVRAGGGHDSIAGQGLRQSRKTGDYLNALTVESSKYPIGQAIQNVRKMEFREAYATLITPIADAGRVGAYLKARGRGETVGEAVWATKVTGANYSQRGNSLQLQALNRMTLFLNPSIQGMDASLNAMKRDPGGWIIRGIVGVMLPSMYLWHANRDDQEIQDLRRTPAGRRYWFTRVNNEIVRIPKPILDGQIFGSTIETILDRMLEDDPVAIETQARALTQDATLHLMPLVGAIPASLLLNQDWNTGMQIAPERSSTLEAEYQTNTNSSILARTISRNVAPWLRRTGIDMKVARTIASPAGIDYIVTSVGGGLAREALRAITVYTQMDDQGVQPVKNELPFVASVYPKSPTLASGPIYEFYRYAGRAERVARTTTHRARYDVVGLDHYLEDNVQWLAANDIILTYRAKMVDLRKAIEDLRAAPNDLFTNPRERQDQIDEMTFQIVEMARNANLTIREINSSMAQATQK